MPTGSDAPIDVNVGGIGRLPFRGAAIMVFLGLFSHITLKNLPFRYEWINQMYPPEKQVKNAVCIEVSLGFIVSL